MYAGQYTNTTYILSELKYSMYLTVWQSAEAKHVNFQSFIILGWAILCYGEEWKYKQINHCMNK